MWLCVHVYVSKCCVYGCALYNMWMSVSDACLHMCVFVHTLEIPGLIPQGVIYKLKLNPNNFGLRIQLRRYIFKKKQSHHLNNNYNGVNVDSCAQGSHPGMTV